MTDRELELQLRAWFNADVPATEAAPAALRATVAAIPRAGTGTVLQFPRRFVALAAAAVLLIGVLLATLVLTTGHGVIKPTQSPATSSPAPSTSAALATLEPTPTATPALLPITYQTDGTTADIFTLDLATGARTKLGTVPVDSVQLRSSTYARISWSPDRTSAIIVRSTDSQQVQARVDLTAHRIDIVGAAIQAISPDGTVGVRNDSSDLVVLSFAGDVIRHLALPAAATIMDPGPFSPDGTSVLTSGCKPCTPSWKSHLFVVPIDGRPIKQLGSVVGGASFIFPSWSPDGTSIVAARNGIVVVDASSGAIKQLTKGPTDASDEQPVWSDDGTRIAFVRFNGALHGLWVMDAGGGNLQRLTTATEDGGDRLPVWSPDGTMLLFTRGPFDQFGDLWQVPSGGGTPQLLLPNAIADW